MGTIRKDHIKYHLVQLLGHCDPRIRNVAIVWDEDKMIGATVLYAGGIQRSVVTVGMRLSEALEKVMDAV